MPLLGGQFVPSLNTNSITSRSCRSTLSGVPKRELLSWHCPCASTVQKELKLQSRIVTRHTTVLHLSKLTKEKQGKWEVKNVRAVFASDFVYLMLQ